MSGTTTTRLSTTTPPLSGWSPSWTWRETSRALWPKPPWPRWQSAPMYGRSSMTRSGKTVFHWAKWFTNCPGKKLIWKLNLVFLRCSSDNQYEVTATLTGCSDEQFTCRKDLTLFLKLKKYPTEKLFGSLQGRILRHDGTKMWRCCRL